MRRIADGIVALACLAGARVSIAREDFDIGTHGAKMHCDEGWRRQRIVASAGDDQFVREVDSEKKAYTYLFVVECGQTVDVEADHRRVIENWFGALDRNLDAKITSEFEFHSSESSTTETDWSRLSCEITELKVRRHAVVQVVSRNGLGFLILSQIDADRAKDGEADGTKLRTALEFPSAKSPWGRSTRPRTRIVRVDDSAVRVSHVPAEIDAKKVANDPLLSLVSPNGDVAVHFLRGSKPDPAGLEGVLDDIVAKVGCDESIPAEMPRTRFQLAGKPALREVRQMPGNKGQMIEMIVAEISAERTIDIRLIYPAPVESVSRIRRALIDSITIDPPRPLDPFTLPPASKAHRTPGAEFAAFLSASRFVTSLDFDVVDADAALDGGILVTTRRSILRIERDFVAAKPLYEGSEVQGRGVSTLGNSLITQGRDGLVRIGPEGQEAPVSFSATRLCGETDSGIALVRYSNATKGPVPLGFVVQETAVPIDFVLRGVDGAERPIATWRPGWVGDSQLDASAKLLYVGVTEVDVSGDRPGSLSSLDLRSGVRTDLLRYSYLRELARADDGVLFTGAPENETYGIWWIHADGSRERLLGGTDGVGMSVAGGKLLFAATSALDDKGSRWNFYSIPLDDARRLGGACALPSAQMMREVARDAIAQCKFSSPWAAIESPAAIEAFLGAADHGARERFGLSLPTEARGVDDVIDVLRVTRGAYLCGSEGAALLAALVARTVIAAGGEWVDSGPTQLPFSRPAFAVYADAEFAVGVSACDFVVSGLDHDRNDAARIADTLDQRLGRRLFVGTRPEAIETACTGAVDRALIDAVSRVDRDVTAITQRLLAVSGNLALRSRVYDRLANDGDIDAMTRISDEFLKGASPAYIDRLAAITARTERFARGDHADTKLAADARGLAEAFPYTAEPFFQLGRVYECSEGDDAKPLAKACYSRVIDLGARGGLLDAAKAGLERCKVP